MMRFELGRGGTQGELSKSGDRANASASAAELFEVFRKRMQVAGHPDEPMAFEVDNRNLNAMLLPEPVLQFTPVTFR